MSVFAQVWLWALVAFLVGGLLTWILLVRPAHQRIKQLEAHVQALSEYGGAANAAPVAASPSASGSHEPREDHAVVARPPAGYRQERAADGQVSESPYAEQETGRPRPSWMEQDSFAGLAQHEPPAQMPGAERSIQEALDANEHSRAQEAGDAAGSGFAAEPEPSGGREALAGHEGQEWPAGQAPAGETPAGQGPAGQGAAEGAAGQELPKRRRSSTHAIRGGFEPPKPIQPTMRPVARRTPQADSEAAANGSLFDPSDDKQGGQAPSDEQASSGLFSPVGSSAGQPETGTGSGHGESEETASSGPFGPGSAMPLADGGQPSANFPVKGSVTALRYCTEDSPQYPRMTAEVWFASPADAERVGFRPLA